MRPVIPRNMVGPVSKSKSEKVKYIDDGTVAVSVSLKECLVPDLEERPKPANFNERTGHVLPSDQNLLQYYVKDTEDFVAKNDMKINTKKSNVMIFNMSRKLDFPPEVKFSDGTNLDVVSEIKLVGVILSNDLKWQKHIDFITKKGMKKIWVLRRLKKMRMTKSFMIDVFIKEVRSVLEGAVQIWNGALTQKQIAAIERVQKTALHIILDKNYVNYEMACTITGLEPLDVRREMLCLNFARKNLKSSESLFMKAKQNENIRSKSANKRYIVKEYSCRTARFEKSSLPYLAKLLNNNCQK